MRRLVRALVLPIAALFLFASIAAAAPSADTTRVIVVLRDSAGTPSEVADALGRQLDFTPSLVYSHALKGFAAEVPAGRLDALRVDPRVAYVELDQLAYAYDQTVPTGVQRIFAPDNDPIGIDGPRVDVDVAVIDTGIDLAHPDLNVFASTNCATGGPFNQTCGSGGNDDNGHGSHVAGTIGALDNGFGVVGVAPGARLWAVKVLNSQGSGYISWIVAGIDYVTANAGSIEVANMSLGCECTSAAMNTAIAKSVAKGVVYAVAAGNSDKDAATFSPANHPDVITVSALADFDGQLGGRVGTSASPPYCRVDQDDTLADFSNWGSLIEITAPGVCIFSTIPGGYATYSGTSMASPHVAGAAALLASGSSTLSPGQIRDTLISTGNRLSWTDDSGDEFKEPLLDVSTTVFAPALVAGSGGGGNTAPTANNTSVSTNVDTPVAVALSGSDTETCELTFSIVRGPGNGTLSLINNNVCSPGTGTPNTDTASVTYTPNSSSSGSDSFTYKVHDGTADSNSATVRSSRTSNRLTISPQADASARQPWISKTGS